MNSHLDWAPMPEPLTADQIHAARLYACGCAHDTDDARGLLDALGIGGAA